MLQAPSHLSRVCGHGHIKKFWLMQTQKESQVCEGKNNLLFSSPTARPSSRGSVKESLSPSSHSCKPSSPSSPNSTSSSGAVAEKDCIDGRFDGVDSLSRILGRDSHPSTPSPRPQPFNVAAEQHHQGSPAVVAYVDRIEPSPLHINYCSEEPGSTSMEHSPDSLSSFMHSRGAQQGQSADCPLETSSCNQVVKLEDRTSPANSSRDFKSLSNHVRFAPSTTGMDNILEKRKAGAILGSRMQVVDREHDRVYQAAHMQHPVLKACSLCGTTKTPMWRSGPQGPKSLCNACGIRFKKYRSFPGQSEPSELMSSSLLVPVASKPFSRPLKRKQNSLLTSCDPPRPHKMCIKSANQDGAPRQQQKKSKWHQLVVKKENGDLTNLNQDRSSPWCAHAGPPSLKKIYGCSPFQSKFKKLAPMDDHLVSGVFAKDEEEAAVLLMHLSCGLVY
ncbi:hypothetical protein GOP47_0004393 [Adiantum capillus-veneris]|uniref:GATA-type domain-containing protein n=1 Tax=Adiantum capillus-veneris TaxID=13818 RepID=A0A9D4V7E0_ADICA|nr:hypothetical protein GOP47_0004393 [Adiantum capillus-veneris]